MAEKDWYGPFGNWTLRHLQVAGGSLAGLVLTIFGFIGFDTSKRAWIIGVPEETRWMGHILWHEVIIGVCFLAYAYFQFRLIKFERQFERKK